MNKRPSLANEARRRFLSRAGLLGAAASLSGLSLIEVGRATDEASTEHSDHAEHGVTNARRWGMLIDTDKCSRGCDACVRGCNQEHGLEADDGSNTAAQWIRKIDLRDKLTGQESSLPMLCQHCESAPCVDVCPTGASFKRADGIVLVNKHTCIGCRYCMMACPYNARSFIHETLTNQRAWAPRGKGTVESCTLCVHRIDADEGQQPACAEACTAEGYDAIVMGDLNDPDSPVSERLVALGAQQIRSDLELNTGVRYTRI